MGCREGRERGREEDGWPFLVPRPAGRSGARVEVARGGVAVLACPCAQRAVRHTAGLVRHKGAAGAPLEPVEQPAPVEARVGVRPGQSRVQGRIVFAGFCVRMTRKQIARSGDGGRGWVREVQRLRGQARVQVCIVLAGFCVGTKAGTGRGGSGEGQTASLLANCRVRVWDLPMSVKSKTNMPITNERA